MRPTELLLIRHGETDWNRALRFQGQVDIALNDIGHQQAQRVCDHLQRSDWAQALHLHSSDLLRARQTAEPFAQALPRTCQPRTGLREQNFGVFDGLSTLEIQAQHPELWAQWRRFEADFALPQGESTRQFHARVMADLQEIAHSHAGERVVVVTHGGVLDMVWRSVHQLSLNGPRQCDIPNAGLNHLKVTQGRFEILAWASTSHLAGMPPQPIYRPPPDVLTTSSAPTGR